MKSSPFISTDIQKLDIEKISAYLGKVAYWSIGRSRADVERSIRNSICFGMYSDAEEQIAFARVVTDRSVFANLMDVVVFDEFKGRGYGTRLLRYVLDYPDLKTVKWQLITKDAHSFYEKFGFQLPKNSTLR